jgi:hypothetical protein
MGSNSCKAATRQKQAASDPNILELPSVVEARALSAALLV